jgi:hypothetical protein
MVGKVQPRKTVLPDGDESVFTATLNAYATDTPVTDRNGLQWDIIRDLRGKGMSDQEILIQSIQAGNLDLVGAILANNPPQGDEKLVIDLNDASRVGMIPLHTAVIGDITANREQPLMLKLLIEGGADIALLDQSGYSVYAHAAQFDKVPQAVKVAKWLKEELNRQAAEAKEKGDNDRVAKLVAAGADPIETDETENPEMPEGTKKLSKEEMEKIEKRLDELDILNMKTSEKGPDGQPLTVNALSIKLLMDKYKEEIDSGAIKSDSAKYKFFYALGAMGDTGFGRTITPFRENGKPGGVSERFQGNPYESTAADMKSMYDEDKVKELFAEAAKDPEVMKDMKHFQDEALKKVDGLDKEKIKGDLKEFLSGQDFKNYMATLTANGEEEKKIGQIQRGLNSYAVVASKEEVDTLVTDMGVNDLFDEIERILSDPGSIEDKYWQAATDDWIAMTLEALNRGLQFGRHGLNSVELAETKKFFQDLRKDHVARNAVADVFKQFAVNGKIPDNASPQMIKEAFDRSAVKYNVPVGQRGKILQEMTKWNKAGAFSTGIGTLALAGAIYQQTAGKAFEGNDHLENMQIARGYLLFLGTAPEILKLGSQITTTSFGKFMGMGDTSGVFGSKSIQDIFKVEDAEGQAARAARANLSTLIDELPFSDPKADDIPKPFEDRIAKFFGGDKGVPDKLGAKIWASLGKVVGSSAFTGFGIVDAVLGGFTFKSGLDNKDPVEAAQGFMQILTGGFTTAAGVTMGLTAAGVTAAAAFTSPFLLIASIIGGVIIGIDIIKGLIAAVNDDQETKAQRDYFKTQAGLGLLHGDWSEQLEFLTLVGYGRDGSGDNGIDSKRPDTPENVSVFDHYDWKRWLVDYNAKWKELGDDYELLGTDPANTRPKLNVMTEEYRKVSDVDGIINEAAGYYAEHINFDRDKRTVPSLENGFLKDRFEKLVRYYLAGDGVAKTKEAAAKWAWDQLISRVGNALNDHPDVQSGRGDKKMVDASQEAVTMLNNNWNKHGGREKAEQMAQDVIDHG